jgi:hypothetical protein
LQERRRTGINGNASWSVVATRPVCRRFGFSAWQRLLCSLAFASVRCRCANRAAEGERGNVPAMPEVSIELPQHG